MSKKERTYSDESTQKAHTTLEGAIDELSVLGEAFDLTGNYGMLCALDEISYTVKGALEYYKSVLSDLDNRLSSDYEESKTITDEILKSLKGGRDDI